MAALPNRRSLGRFLAEASCWRLKALSDAVASHLAASFPLALLALLFAFQLLRCAFLYAGTEPGTAATTCHAFTDISRDVLAAAAPDLAPVPSEFIRHGLLAKSSLMQAGIRALAPSHLPSSLPRNRMLSSQYSTNSQGSLLHLANRRLQGTRPSSRFTQSSLSCTVPSSHLSRPFCPRRTRLTLRVLPITLPSPPAFSKLHARMYTGRLDDALGSLLPLPASFLASLSSPSRGAPAADVMASALRTPHLLRPLAPPLGQRRDTVGPRHTREGALAGHSRTGRVRCGIMRCVGFSVGGGAR
ncbi:Clampless protein 1 [Mycena sanguinolenta]|uniref:Clampless protein 1 n=1 Tax=Mycena sanguinolenta TaxID=230812 RepID=A0A8H7DCA8_9AGAR|nr:Clampless protein 1 [Mycena sanguinolenta]